MEEFWIQLLAILMLLYQTGGASDTTELIRAVGGAVTFRSPDTDPGGNAAFWNFGDDPIATVPFEDPSQPLFSKECETRCTVSESGRALSITQLRVEDAGNYSVTIGWRKIATFTLQVYRELPEPTVTCEAQNCLDSSCLISLLCSVPGDGFGDISYTWTGWDQQWGEKSVVLAVVDKSSWDNLEPLMCTAWNAVSSRSVTVTNPERLCPGNSEHPPRPGAPSIGGVGIKVIAWVTAGVIAGVAVLVILLVFLVFFCKSQRPSKRFLDSPTEPGPQAAHLRPLLL